jgi:antitoxin YokJ
VSESLAQTLDRLRVDPSCLVLPPAGQPLLPPGFTLPDDLAAFYSQCGGAGLHIGLEYESWIVEPGRFLHANTAILGEEHPDDRSSSWFVVAVQSTEPLAVIDLAEDRIGRCYDAFHETYGLVGDMATIALSFEELLTSLSNSRGDRWYWLEADWTSLGDAYD